ncbi:hypoxanthine phosphoribosyltransferase [Thermanaeromonas toyohensis ToBE]|uniref:Hypoxanthine phosphoribosyltransferase n=1 Tax=Thermanaeromonas toyohensis ToBE TaxID=698762 RepID=A0A1W1W4B5_9FIRM|nr:hypoxanthine phosphoribosyltransferase [Thermanaeromonas toyohensis]SMB99904.1 hypoxanthine phosphoribosyltransferase [Thermanaeromonas toyohensis ToBE]
MREDIAQVLVTGEQIKQRVKELGEAISRDYEGKDLLVVGILKGAIIFLADLVREITIPITLDFMAVSSYGSGTSSSGVVRILKDLEVPVEDKHVLIVEDIVDTGLTLKYLLDNLRARQPLSLKCCTILDKPERRLVDVQIDYRGFCIPDYFVVGYGLDYNQKYRHLPDICVLKPEVYRRS